MHTGFACVWIFMIGTPAIFVAQGVGMCHRARAVRRGGLRRGGRPVVAVGLANRVSLVEVVPGAALRVLYAGEFAVHGARDVRVSVQTQQRGGVRREMFAHDLFRGQIPRRQPRPGGRANIMPIITC